MLKRQLGNHRGVSIVEFALVLPLLLGFLGATVDFGLAFFVSHITQNAAREGARLAVTIENLPSGRFAVAKVDQRIDDLLLDINLFQGFTHTTTFDPAACEVTVTVSGESPYFFIPAFVATLSGANGTDRAIAIERTVRMRYEHECTAAGG